MEKKTILVVDDEPLVLDVLSELLRREGYEVISAPDGKSALDAFRKEKPSLVLLDFMMPHVDGLTVLKEIRQQGSATPVIIITAYGSSDIARKALELGALDFIIKPFGVENVLHTVQFALEKSAPEIDAGRQKKLIELLSKELERAERARISISSGKDIEELKTICAGIGHGLKGEFLHIGSSLKDLREIAGTSSEAQEECQIIERSLQYSRVMLQRLLTYLDLGRLPQERVDVLDVLRRVESMIKPRLPSNIELRIVLRGSRKVRYVSSNADQLMVILIELINNATKALDERGGKIRLGLAFKNGKAAISVKDDGPGIAKERRKEFFKKPVSGAGREPGFGLFLCKKMVQNLGGRLMLETTVGKGTTITILVPLAGGQVETQNVR